MIKHSHVWMIRNFSVNQKVLYVAMHRTITVMDCEVRQSCSANVNVIVIKYRMTNVTRHTSHVTCLYALCAT
jgi:hypothetical protein